MNEKGKEPLGYAVGFRRMGGNAQILTQSFPSRDKAVDVCNSLSGMKGAHGNYEVFEIWPLSNSTE